MKQNEILKILVTRNFPGSPVFKTRLPVQGGRGSIPGLGSLRSHIPCGQEIKT